MACFDDVCDLFEVFSCMPRVFLASKSILLVGAISLFRKILLHKKLSPVRELGHQKKEEGEREKVRSMRVSIPYSFNSKELGFSGDSQCISINCILES